MAAIALQTRRETSGTCSASPLGSLDSDVVSAAIPAFFIGRNAAGLWVAREATGRTGGLFLLKSSAIAFAYRQSGAARCALVFPAERFELDVENRGNLIVAPAERWLRRVSRLLARMTGGLWR